MIIKFLITNNEVIYPDNINLFGESEIVTTTNSDDSETQHVIAEYFGDTLPPNSEELEGSLESNLPMDSSIVKELNISKVRFLDLLGDKAIAFKVAIKTQTDPVIQATLEVAEQYLNATETVNLNSIKTQQFLQMLMTLNIMDQADYDLIVSNTTLEESQA